MSVRAFPKETFLKSGITTRSSTAVNVPAKTPVTTRTGRRKNRRLTDVSHDATASCAMLCVTAPATLRRKYEAFRHRAAVDAITKSEDRPPLRLKSPATGPRTKRTEKDYSAASVKAARLPMKNSAYIVTTFESPKRM